MASFRILLVYPNLMAQTMYPMGLALLSAVLKCAGYTVESFDTTFYQTDQKAPHEYQIENLQLRPLADDLEQALRRAERPVESMVSDFRAKVLSFQPDLIAVSAVEDTFPQAVNLLDGVGDLGIPTLVGGVFATFAPEKAIREPSIDMICIGEGEYAIRDLCDALSSSSDHTRIRNLWVKKKDGEVVKNPMRPTLQLDDLPPPDYELFDHSYFYLTSKAQGRVLNSGSVETARGCPYRCSFCNSPSQVEIYKKADAGRFFRLKSVEKVEGELRKLKEVYKTEYIYFPADTFLALPDTYLYELAEAYESISLPFWCQTRSETLSEERIRILEKMGCQNVSIGLEHGNQEFRRRVVRRDYSNEAFMEKFRLLQSASFHVTVNNILGLPTEDRRLTWETINLNRKVADQVSAINAFHFVPYHGTVLRQTALELGYIDDKTPVVHNFKDTVLDMPQYRRDEIRGAVRTFTMYVRFPESWFPRIAEAERFDDKGNATFLELKQQFLERYFQTDELTM